MVKLPSPEEQAARPVGERGSHRPQQTRSHHQWGARYGRRREEMRQRAEPTSLLQLEHRARQAAALMEKYAPSDGHFPVAMQLLRMQHNLLADTRGATCNMLSPTLILTSADTVVNRVHATIDIENIVRTLQQLQQQQQNEKLEQVKEQDRKNRDESDSENEFLDAMTFGSLKPQEVENLIQAALKEVAPDKTKYINSVRHPSSYKEKDTSGEINLYSLLQEISNRPDDDDNSAEKLYILKDPERKNKIKQIYINPYMDQTNKLLPESKSVHISKKKQLQPNDLLGDVVYSEPVNRAEPSDLNDYSKVYVILNVDAIQQTKMRNRLTDLVYSLLQSPPRPSDYGEQNRQHRYKGFLINDDYRRAGKRHSGEVYTKKDISMDYKPKSKRLRSRDHGGGGGGGRTPIPYIRNRGDIYEKEN